MDSGRAVLGLAVISSKKVGTRAWDVCVAYTFVLTATLRNVSTRGFLWWKEAILAPPCYGSTA